jgi:hypothetical protein
MPTILRSRKLPSFTRTIHTPLTSEQLDAEQQSVAHRVDQLRYDDRTARAARKDQDEARDFQEQQRLDRIYGLSNVSPVDRIDAALADGE